MNRKERIKKFLDDAGFKEAPDFETFLTIAPSNLLPKSEGTAWAKKFEKLHDKSFVHMFKQIKKRRGTERSNKAMEDLIVHAGL